MKSFGHNYNSLVQTISYFVHCEDIDIIDVRESLKDIVAWSQENKISYKLKYVGLPDITVAAVMSIQLEYANSLGVQLEVTFSGDTQVNLNRKTLIDMLNIVTENAIEVAHYTETKVVKVGLWFGEDKFTMTISNEYAMNESGNIKKHGKSHGVGLESIHNLGLDYVSVSHSAQDGRFSLTIEVRNTR
jgi:signal transduction histidine kinase